jgi:hypothetical protein
MTILDSTHTTARPVGPLQQLLTDSEAVVKAIQVDDCGQIIGQVFVGGNGGLLSNDTLRAVDRLRLTIAAIKAEEAGKGT